MRLKREDQTVSTPVQLPSLDQYVVGQLPELSDETKTSIVENDPKLGADYFTFVARATNDAVRDWNVITGALSWPHGFQSLFGYDAASAEFQINFWQKNLHPGDRTRIDASIRDALAGNDVHWAGEYRFRRADGTDLNILERALIVRDATGAATRFIGSLMDVTARKQLQDQLCRSQRMEAFGQLAAGVAHDFNNFLTTILGYGDLLLSERHIKGMLADHVTEIRSAAGRASALTQQLLAFSRRQPLEAVVVEVNSLIANLERSLLRLIGEHISVVCHLHHEKAGAHINADHGHDMQTVLNLAVNARDAMPHGGQLTLEMAIIDVTAEKESPLSDNDVAPGQYVLIRVGDTGTGMNKEVKAHLFEPFFTTKIDDHRSGLGLATSYGIVRQSGGHL